MFFIPIALFSTEAPVAEPVSAPVKINRPQSKKVDGVRSVTNGTDFAVHRSVSSNFKQLTDLEFLKKYGDKVILCVSADEKREYADSLATLKKKYNTQVCYSDSPGKEKGRDGFTQSLSDKVFLSKFAVRREIDPCLHEKHVIFVRPESFVQDGAGAVCEILDRCNMDVASVAVLPTENNESAERLRGAIAVRANLLYPKLKSNGEKGK